MSQRKGKGTSTKARTIEQYCSVCKKVFDMPVVEEADNHEVVWLKCPGCDGFLPYMTEHSGGSDESEAEREAEAERGGAMEELALEDIDIEKAKEYNETDEYKVGQVIYHRSWNDYGKIIAKETLPGHRKTIFVHFVNQGKIRLLEGVS